MNARSASPTLPAKVIASFWGGPLQLGLPPVEPVPTTQKKTRVNCYTPLYQLLDQQRNLDRVPSSESEGAEFRILINAIADASDVGAGYLEELARNDPSIRLERNSLAQGETGGRNSVAGSKTGDWPKPLDPGFELLLLLRQAEALACVWHLATAAAQIETNPERASHLAALGEQMKSLQHRAVSMMRSGLPRSGTTAFMPESLFEKSLETG